MSLYLLLNGFIPTVLSPALSFTLYNVQLPSFQGPWDGPPSSLPNLATRHDAYSAACPEEEVTLCSGL